MTGTVERLLTEHLDTWTAAVETKSAAGRGSSKKLKLVGIQKLRELILELAVRGQLVPQNENDEPASVLLERIAVERQRLVKEKKIKKPKKLPEISDDEKPFDLPKGWAWSRLNNLGEWGAGATPRRGDSELYGGDIPWFKSGELNSDYISESDETITELALKKSSLRYNKIGDVLVAMYGATIGKTSILSVRATTNQAVCACTLFDGILNTYLLTLLKAYKPRFIGMGAGGAQPNISREKIISTVVAVPPKEEQKHIVAKVDELMALCDVLEQEQESCIAAHGLLVENLLAALTNAANQGEFKQAWARVAEHFDTLFTTEQSVEQLKQTILQLAVMGKLVEQDPTDEPASVLLERIAAEKKRLVEEKVIKKQKVLPEISEEEKVFELPEGWAWCRLGSLINLVSGQHLKPQEYSEEKSLGMIPYLTGPADFGKKYPVAVRFTNEKRAAASIGGILITCKGSGIGKINEADTEVAISRQLMSAQPILISTSFVKLLMLSLRAHFRSNSVGIAIPGISREDVTEAVAMLPPACEQERIMQRAEQLSIFCDQLKIKILESQKIQLELASTLTGQRAI